MVVTKVGSCGEVRAGVETHENGTSCSVIAASVGKIVLVNKIVHVD